MGGEKVAMPSRKEVSQKLQNTSNCGKHLGFEVTAAEHLGSRALKTPATH